MLRFAIVGLSGVAVNLAVVVALTMVGPDPETAVAGIPATDFHARWYHVFSFTAFLIANLWNFHWNRSWSFRSNGSWARQYRSFLMIGLLVQGLGLGVLTLLMHPSSPITLPRSILDDSSFFATRVYWAQLLTIAVVTPTSFLLNKLWTFRSTPSQAAPPAHARQPPRG